MDFFFVNPYAFRNVVGHGYVFGGWPSGSAITTVQKFNFSTNSSSTLGTGLATARMLVAGFASYEAGYAVGGISGTPGSPTYLSSLEKFAFSNDARSSVTATLSTGVSSLTGFASSVAGYAAGGTNATTRYATVDKFVFSSEAKSTLGSGLSAARTGMAGFSSSDSGYVAGGITGTPAITNIVEKFAFSTDARSAVSNSLGTSRSYSAGVNSESSGYVAGGGNGTSGSGTPGTFYSTVDKYAFSNDSRSTLALLYSPHQPSGISSFSAGYVVGGATGSTVYASGNKINFSSDSISSIASALSVAVDGAAGASAPIA